MSRRQVRWERRARLAELLREHPFDFTAGVPAMRVGFDALMRSHPVPEDVTVVEDTVGGVPVARVTGAGADPDKAVIYVHGGAFVLGSAGASAGMTAEIACRVGASAVSADYRLAPEHPFPAAPDDVLAVYRGVLASGIDAANIAVVGESAGGGLVAGLLAGLDKAGLPQPACGVLLSPWGDLAVRGASMETKADADPILTPAALRRCADYYLGDADAGKASATELDFAGVAPLLIHVGANEILLDDAVSLARQAAEADVSVRLRVWAGLPHVFQSHTELADEAVEALAEIAAFVTDCWE